MSFWKAITGKRSHHFPDAFPNINWNRIPFICLGNELSFQLLHPFAGIKMTHRAAKQIGFRKIKSSDYIRNSEYLFLVEDHTERFIQQRCKCWVNMLYRLQTLKPADKGILKTTAQGTRAVQCKRSHNVIFAACMPGLSI